jgi:hypothetical protein
VTARTILLLAGATVLSVGLLECGSRIEYRLSTGSMFPADAYRDRLAPTTDADLVVRADPTSRPAEEDEPRVIANKVLHPYIGFVHDHAGAPKSTNRFGFPGLDPLWPPAEGELRVGIAGGSVALQIFHESGRHLRRALSEHPAFAGRKIRLIALTLGGFKQPQQLMSLTWFLALGAHFDVVINLDGFNEVVLPFTDNVPDGVFPAFPRSWKLYAQKSLDGSEIDALIEVRGVQRERRRWRERLGNGPLSSSAFVLRTLDAIDQRLAVRLAESEGRFRAALDGGSSPYQVSGPDIRFPNNAALFRELVAVWRDSSLQMHRLCEANAIAYFHFLQPNQYVAGSKPFSAEERRVAIRGAGFAPRTAVRSSYESLSASGASLHSRGVAFQDLTNLFESESETVYRDSCCHFNDRGVRAIADRIAGVVGEGVPPESTAVIAPRGGGESLSERSGESALE